MSWSNLRLQWEGFFSRPCCPGGQQTLSEACSRILEGLLHTVFTLVLLFCKTSVQQRHDVHDKFQGTGCPACCRSLSHRCRGAVMLMSPDNCPQAALPEVLLPWGSWTRWLDPLGQFPHLEIWSQVISLARPVPPVACPCMELGSTGNYLSQP